jgi:hypothetical protein
MFIKLYFLYRPINKIVLDFFCIFGQKDGALLEISPIDFTVHWNDAHIQTRFATAFIVSLIRFASASTVSATVLRSYASKMRSKFFNRVIQRTLQMSTTTSSTCPITGVTSGKSIPLPPTDGSNPRPYSEVPGPAIYPLVGSIIDFANTGGNTSDSNTSYYYKYGAITKQNICGDEVIICDPREHIKGELILLIISATAPKTNRKMTYEQFFERRENIQKLWQATSGPS